ncbi:hypothetical protein AVEN_156325-1 [Araneus ventricosus]|uniref:Uncharacterized protein n=1 Tax=Araneus ventricosus TaxID=182803 RepID=A0A4Y2L6Z3_ARAVE|nr:hypothetical protein AVEN_156325-1 [Araneus ventricosus]
MNSKQAENLMKLDKVGNIKVKASSDHTLNYSKGVISESEFQRDLEEDLLDCLKNQNVIAVKRITIKRHGQIFPTKHLILTFNNPTLPKSVKIAYINCPVKPYIPDPIRCFKCQKFGDTITACRSNKENCACCSLPDHNSQTCKSTAPKCFNCSASNITTPTPSTSTLSENSSIPEKPKIKRHRDNKNLTKKSNQLAQAKESKEDKRARILAAKRDQTSLGDGSLSREDFLKDSFKTNKIGDDDSDSLLKVHPSEDDMSTSEVDEPPHSS